jgi:hypothetical protein
MTAVAAAPTSGVHLSTVFAVTCSAAANNDSTAYSTSVYPTEPQVEYYFKFARTGSQTLKSPVFSTNPDGTGAWYGVILPDVGTYTLTLNKVSDDSVAATTTVVVS